VGQVSSDYIHRSTGVGKQLFFALGYVDRIVWAKIHTPIPHFYFPKAYLLPILAKNKVYSVFIRVRHGIDMVNRFKPTRYSIAGWGVTLVV
jgi:hypothetical protein